MAKSIAAGIAEQAPDCTVRCLHIHQIDKEHPDNVAFVNEADAVLIGTPDYYAGECWRSSSGWTPAPASWPANWREFLPRPI